MPDKSLRSRQVPINSYKDVLPVLRVALNQLDHPFIKKMEEMTGINREKLFYIFCAFLTFWLVLGPGNDLLCNLIGVVYPMHQSVLAVRTRTKHDDTQWLIYWCSFALFTLFDYAVTSLAKTSLYLVVKTIVLLYLALPQTYGAHNVYVHYVDPLVDWFDGSFAKIS